MSSDVTDDNKEEEEDEAFICCIPNWMPPSKEQKKKHESVCLKQKQLSTYRLSNLLSQLLMFVAYVSLSVWWVSGEVHTNSFGFSSVSGYHHIQVCVLTCEWIWVSAAILHLLAANVPKRVLNYETHCKRILGESRWAGVMLRILHAE